MRGRTIGLGAVIACVTAALAMWVASAADASDGLTAAQRKQFEQDAKRLEEELESRTPGGFSSDYPTKLTRLGIVSLALGNTDKALELFERALNAEREQDRLMGRSMFMGEDAFMPVRLRNQWLARDAYLSFPPRTDAAINIAYGRVWDTKGASTRWLERTYAAMRRMYGISTSQNPTPAREAVLQERSEVRRQIVRLMLEPTKDTAGRDRRLKELFDRKHELMRNNVSLLASTHVPDGMQVVHEAPPHALLRALPEDTVFVDFLRYARLELDPERPGLLGEHYVPSYVAFILAGVQGGGIGPKGIAYIDLGPCKPIDDAIVSWRASIEVGEDSLEQAALVGRLTWEPIVEVFPPGISTVYLSPDGQLSTLPWAALPGHGGNILLKDYALAQVPDGHFLLGELFQTRSQARSPVDVRARVLVVGGVHADLPGTGREVARVKHFAGERPIVELSGTEATPARLKVELPKASYAHLATHGFFAEAALLEERRRIMENAGSQSYGSAIGMGSHYPLAYTGLILAGSSADTPVWDQVLTSETIPEQDLGRLRICVLSACQTGRGDVTSGEGVQGLARAFHLAGCANVITSLWNVSDSAAEPLMAEFYRQLWVEKKEPIQALRLAQLELYRHPELAHRSIANRDAPIKLNDSKPVNTSGRPGVDAKTGITKPASPTKWWAAFVLSGSGRGS